MPTSHQFRKTSRRHRQVMLDVAASTTNRDASRLIDATPVPTAESGVYVLTRGGQVVYVGHHASGVVDKAYSHRGSRTKRFDGILLLQVGAAQAAKLCALLQRALRPEYNVGTWRSEPPLTAPEQRRLRRWLAPPPRPSDVAMAVSPQD